MIVEKKINTEFEPRHLSRPDSYQDGINGGVKRQLCHTLL